MDFQPFRVAVADDVLEDLRRRLRQTRWPDQIPGSGWNYGTDLEYLRELCLYWEAKYDWRAFEAAFNAWPQFTTTVDGQRIHFIHAWSPHQGARPLLLLHGWPSSPLEFLKVLGPLTDPAAYGGDPADAFHVIAPSMPGYGWSGPTTEPGWAMARVAAAFTALLDGLGYPRFAVHGGDWGSPIATEIARTVPERLLGLHLTMLVTGGLRPEDGEPTEEEKALMAAQEVYNAAEQAYLVLQATKPQTLAYGLSDSPAGLASWIVEKLRTWTDCGGHVESVFSKDEILAWITTYWVTGTAGSSARLYFETARAGQMSPPAERVEVPTGIAVFPKELYRTTRRVAEHHYNVVRWAELPRGGHFAAAEQPGLLVEELRQFYRGQEA
jgi:microsomal epoxide hydrolase